MESVLSDDLEGNDKRATARWSVRLRCRFVVAGESHHALITDISAGGAFIESEYCPQADMAATLHILLGTQELSIRGIVRHSGWFLIGLRNGNGFGLEFENLSGQAEIFVEKVLARLTEPAEKKTSLEL